MMRRRLIAFLTGVTLTLGACASLPISGAPQAFDIDAPTPSAVDFVAGAPTKGASPEALVEGFLRACSAGTSDDFATARLFLSERSAAAWNPAESISVYATDATPLLNSKEKDGGLAIHVSTPTVAEVDKDGILVEAGSEKDTEVVYSLIQEKGEWRINSLPDGIVLSLASFLATYQRAQLYFPLNVDRTLASEPHWYPQKNLNDYLLAALHRGPTGFLRDVASTALPSTAISIDTEVDPYSGEAVVTLEGDFPAGAHARELIARQITQTLRQSAQVSTVNVYINGETITLEEVKDPPRLSLDAAIASKNSEVGLVINGEFSLLKTVGASVNSPDTQGVEPEHWEGLPEPSMQAELAVSPVDSSIIAWVDGGKLTVVDRKRRMSVVVDNAYSSPSLDRFGWAWTLGVDSVVSLVNPIDGNHLTMPGSLSDLSALRVSPDGVRLAMLRRENEGHSVWLGTIIRDEHGVPADVQNVVPVGRLGSAVRDMSWASSDALVAIQGTDSLHKRVVTVPIGGFAESILAPTGAERVSAGGSAALVYLTDNHQQVWARSNALWQPLDGALRRVRFPG